MKLAKALTLAVCAVALLGLWACQQDATSTPTAPASTLLSVSNEVRGNGYGIGGVKVDSYCNICSADLEDNTIAPGQTMVVWINSGTGDFCASYSYEVSDKNYTYIPRQTLGGANYTCGTNQGYIEPAPGSSYSGGSESVTLTVWCDDTNTRIGSDSFRLIDNGNCEK